MICPGAAGRRYAIQGTLSPSVAGRLSARAKPLDKIEQHDTITAGSRQTTKRNPTAPPGSQGKEEEMKNLFEINGAVVEVSGEDKQAVYSACVRVGGDLKGTGRCRPTKSSALELARQIIEQYFTLENPPEGSELYRADDDLAIYIVPFCGVYVVAKRIAIWQRYDHFQSRHFYSYDWVIETWHTTLEAARRAAALI
jgi:hypothetical protein